MSACACVHVCSPVFNRPRSFRIRFPGSGSVLARLAELCDTPDETISFKVKVSKTFPLTTKGVKDAFTEQMTRRAVGKVVLDLDLERK